MARLVRCLSRWKGSRQIVVYQYRLEQLMVGIKKRTFVNAFVSQIYLYSALYLCTRKQVGGQVDFQSCTVRSLTKRFGVLRH